MKRPDSSAGRPARCRSCWRGSGLLRQRLARRGVVLPAPLLAALLTEEAAPAAVAGSLLRATLLGCGTPTLTETLIAKHIVDLAEGVLTSMATSKLRNYALVAVAVALLGTATALGLIAAGTAGPSGPVAAPPPPAYVADEPKAPDERTTRERAGCPDPVEELRQAMQIRCATRTTAKKCSSARPCCSSASKACASLQTCAVPWPWRSGATATRNNPSLPSTVRCART